MFFSLLALYAGLKLPRSWKWVLTSSLACLFLLWIKGPFFIFGFLLMSIGYFFSMEKEKRISFLISAYFLSGALIVLSAFSFEWITRKLTGESFFLAFWNIQIQQRALSLAHKYPFVIQKIINFYYYFSHYLAYALPWSFFLIIILVKKVRVSTTFKTCSQFIKSPLSLCILTSAMSFCLLFSLSDRTAGRYTFPGYYMFAAWTILFLYDQSSLFKRFHQSIMKLGLHYVVPGLWLLAFGLHFIKKS
jgi:hypothetical protein